MKDRLYYWWNFPLADVRHFFRVRASWVRWLHYSHPGPWMFFVRKMSKDNGVLWALLYTRDHIRRPKN